MRAASAPGGQIIKALGKKASHMTTPCPLRRLPAVSIHTCASQDSLSLEVGGAAS